MGRQCTRPIYCVVPFCIRKQRTICEKRNLSGRLYSIHAFKEKAKKALVRDSQGCFSGDVSKDYAGTCYAGGGNVGMGYDGRGSAGRECVGKDYAGMTQARTAHTDTARMGTAAQAGRARDGRARGADRS